MRWIAKVPLVGGSVFYGYGDTPEAAARAALSIMKARNELRDDGKIKCCTTLGKKHDVQKRLENG